MTPVSAGTVTLTLDTGAFCEAMGKCLAALRELCDDIEKCQAAIRKAQEEVPDDGQTD